MSNQEREKINAYAKANDLPTLEELEEKLTSTTVQANRFFEASMYDKLVRYFKEKAHGNGRN